MPETETDSDLERTASRSADTDRRANGDGITGHVVSVLWNRTEGRPRALWRIFGVYVASFVGIFILPALALAGTELPPSVTGAATNVIGALVGLLVAIVFAKYVDRRPLTDYGLAFGPSWLKDFGAGSVIALVGMAVALLVNLLAGWATVSELFSGGAGASVLPFAAAFGVYTIQWAFTAFWEELIFRGLILTSAVEGLRSRWLSDRGAVLLGVVVSSLIFSIGHFPGSLETFGFRVVLGILLGAAYVWTDSLALPIGLHFLLNFTINNIYGLANFGEAAEVLPMLIRPTFTGPSQFVQVFGLVNLGAMLCVAALTVGYVALRNGDFESRLSSAYIQ
ncbi:CPBP family intramembrane glutamic endopeptidase [Natronomonas marina]|jgi:membrane protease YdiL (CAAX protease family)|uniref:CPBP family intramembrane glutamic endopeptidase n=1 Tax=Natronomonas marina TaxID=2961939 RepID=UPI0020C99F2F|nr:type II CAAX endopeptidase family protein [Natronomonas marina]